jgi:hypothetical protein
MDGAPVERKVAAATGGSAVGVALAGLILWLLGAYVFTSGPVPDALAFAVVTLLPVGLTLAGGYLARHTPRADIEALAESRASNVRRVVNRADVTPPPDRQP